MMLHNTTARFVALHFLLAALSSLLVLAFVYWSTTRVIETEMRQVVQAEIAGLSENYTTMGILGLVQAIDRRVRDDDQRDAVYLLTDAQGRMLAGNIANWPPNVVPGTGWIALDLFRADTNNHSELSAATFLLPGGERLLVGRDARARVAFDATLIRALLTALGLTALLAAMSGWLLSRFVTRRIGEITDTAAEIVAGGLTRRVPLRGNGDEFDRLGSTLNAMLDRIEALVGDMRMVTDSVAHDLRSPLTRLVSHLESATDETQPNDERANLIQRAMAEAEGVLKAFTALLAIARTEAGMGRDQFAPVDLGKLLDAAAELYGPVADEKNITLRRHGNGSLVNGHQQLLAQAASNLIENAIRHAPNGSEIELDSGETTPLLAVSDHGPGISADNRARAVQRFVRLEPSRSGPGTGLGLSLVGAVARMHGGELELSDNDPGLRAEIRFDRKSGATTSPAPNAQT